MLIPTHMGNTGAKNRKRHRENTIRKAETEKKNSEKTKGGNNEYTNLRNANNEETENKAPKE